MGETAASLELLKGSKKEAKEAPTAEITVDEEIELDIDIDSLTMESIDELVEKYSLDVPENWASLTLDAKKDWLRTQSEDAPAEPEPPKPEPVAETKKPAKEKKAKAEKPKPEPEIKKVDPKTQPKTTQEAVEAVFEDAKPEPAAKPEKKEKKSKSTAVAVAPLQGEIMDGDLIVDIVYEVETMNEQDARKTVSALNENTEKTYFKLGGVLSVILKNKWYDPYGHFRDLVEKEYGIHYRKAMYWISIYDHLVESKVPWNKVKDIGWAKLKELADIITLDNVDEWVSIAKSQPQLQFLETVKAAKNADKPLLEDQSQPSITTNKTFKCHSGQKETIEAAINKAKDEGNTSVDTVALEYICLDYLGGDSLTKRLAKMPVEDVLKAVEKAFPNVNLSVEIS